MGNISAEIKYLRILQYHCIPKAQSKVSDTVGDNYAPDFIDGYAVSGKV